MCPLLDSSVVPLSPFLKWAGGKRWLVEARPEFFAVPFERYIEPFLGGGAVFFSLRPKTAILGDRNESLIKTYQAIAKDWRAVERRLRLHQKNHCNAYYYRMRDVKPRSASGFAAQFIYLNRTCWNGLYRVNQSGRFNVPIGTKTAVVMGTDNFGAIAGLLERAKLHAADFSEILEQAKAGDFVFVDPPYTVKHNNNGFIKYNELIFTWADQVRLRDCIRRATQRGAAVLVTNAAHSSIGDLYRGVGEISRITRRSVISGAVHGRGAYEEFLIKCF